jgi:hypothetical protein
MGGLLGLFVYCLSGGYETSKDGDDKLLLFIIELCPHRLVRTGCFRKWKVLLHYQTPRERESALEERQQ